MYTDKFMEKIEEEFMNFSEEEMSLDAKDVFFDAKKIVFFSELVNYLNDNEIEEYMMKALLQFEDILDTLYETFKDEGYISFNTEDDIEYFIRSFVRDNCFIEDYDY